MLARGRRPPRHRWTGPIISPTVVRAFLNRELDDYSFLKQATEHELFQQILPLSELFPATSSGFSFHTKPRLHQLASFYAGICMPQFLFLLDPGAGKTKIILDTFYWRMLNRQEGPFVVIVPAAANTDGWMEQVEIHRPELKAVQLLGSQDQRIKLLGKEADVYLIHYDGLMSFMTKLVKGKGREIDHKAAPEFADFFAGFAADEIHQVGNKASLTFRMLNALSNHHEIRYGATGTPFGRNPEKLWAQFYIVDHGETLGPTLGLYRSAFFIAKERYWGGYDYKFDIRREGDLHKLLQHRSIRYEDKEFADTPDIMPQTHKVSFGMDARKYYEQVLDQLKQSRGNLQEQRNSFLRMRQVCSGFLSVRGEDEEKILVSFYNNPKLEALETRVLGLPEGEKYIVYHEFVRSGDMICEMLDRHKIRWARVGKKHDAVASMRRFKRDENTQVLIWNYMSGGGAGLNMHDVCRRIGYYESPVDPIVRTQTGKRIVGGLRTVAGKRVYVDDFIVANSVEVRILEWLAEGRDLFQAIIEGHSRSLFS